MTLDCCLTESPIDIDVLHRITRVPVVESASKLTPESTFSVGEANLSKQINDNQTIQTDKLRICKKLESTGSWVEQDYKSLQSSTDDQQKTTSDLIMKTTRRSQLRRYLKKKYTKVRPITKFSRMRKQVANKRLRVEGRFVTKHQALLLLGLTQEDLLGNETIQDLLNVWSSGHRSFNSVIQNDKKGGRIVKVRNFQALIDDSYSNQCSSALDHKSEGIKEFEQIDSS